jgi:hypothetical protein
VSAEVRMSSVRDLLDDRYELTAHSRILSAALLAALAVSVRAAQSVLK